MKEEFDHPRIVTQASQYIASSDRLLAGVFTASAGAYMGLAASALVNDLSIRGGMSIGIVTGAVIGLTLGAERIKKIIGIKNDGEKAVSFKPPEPPQP